MRYDACASLHLLDSGCRCTHRRLTASAFRKFDLAMFECALWLQEKLYAYVSIGGHHQNTSLNTTDARSPSWSDTLTFEHPSLNHTELSVAVYAKHTLLPDTLVGSAGNGILRLSYLEQMVALYLPMLQRFVCCRVPFEPDLRR